MEGRDDGDRGGRERAGLARSAHLRWLYEELPALVRAGVLAPADAERLHRHYGDLDRSVGRRIVVGLFGVLGALSIGGGVILVLAHNWDQLSRPARAALSIAPLALSIVLAAWVVARGRGAAWREAAAALWALAIGSSISLVAQTYNLPGDWTTFLRTWLLLGVPILYLLASVTAGLLYALGALAWVLSCAWGAGEPLWFLPLLALALPFVGRRMARVPQGPGTELLAWAYAIVLGWGVLPSLERLDGLVWGPLLLSVFLGLWVGGALAGEYRWRRPLRVVGGLGAVGVAVALTFAGAWEGPARARAAATLEVALETALVMALALGALALCALAWRRTDRIDAAVALAAVPAAWLGLLLARAVHPDAAAVAANLLLLGLGVLLLVRGLREARLARANLGTAILGVLVLVRFFDTEWSFLARGAALIAIGVGFVVVNLALVRRREAA